MSVTFFKRLAELGINGTIQALQRRLQKHWMRTFYKVIRQKKTTHKHTSADFLKDLINLHDFYLFLPDKFKDNNWIVQQADAAANNCFDILGSGLKCFEKIPWHQDFKSNNFAKTPTWKTNFYQDITASCPTKMSFNDYNPDIKVPWELSRFQHIFVLGKAYQISSKSQYASAFQDQITDWIEKNSYLIGVNWVCPMDVAIRAINWIWGFYFFKDAQNIPAEFWIKFINTLHEHMHYLEFNWETSDKPNNHYLCDLLGYLYLCNFFDLKKKKTWCIKKLLTQFFHQIQPDGTCYEGTTGYHRLDTEIFFHFKLICQASEVTLPDEFLKRFDKMIEFLQDCSSQDWSSLDCNFITIGDNDSGKILTGIKIPSKINNQHEVFNYQDFGLVIIKKFGVHITLRTPNFKQNQPTGHFHHDQLAVTLSINGTPILVDPGSYVYTANSAWRNLMRGAESHNTFYCPELNPDNFQASQKNSDLFQLNLKQQADHTIINHNNLLIQVTACNKTAWRMLEIDQEKKIKITDWWDTNFENFNKQKNSEWNLIFNPELELKKESPNIWIVKKDKTTICHLFSTLNFVELTGFYSKEYGILQKCTKLKAIKNISAEKQTIIFTI